jgi:hypothetical protein
MASSEAKRILAEMLRARSSTPNYSIPEWREHDAKVRQKDVLPDGIIRNTR